MSLVAWIPFVGNSDNQGVETVTLSSGTATYTAGKLGQCLSSGVMTYTAPTTLMTELTTSNTYSIMAWVKYTVTDTGNWVFRVYGDTSASNSRGLWRGANYTTALHWAYQNSGTNISISTNVADGEWHHTCFVVNGSTVSAYIDGVYEGKITSGKTDIVSTGTTYVECRASVNYLNDFRLYDHCLSAKEVKEVSKGLILHYPLNNVYSTSIVNKYSGEAAKGNPTTVKDTISGSATFSWASDGTYHYTLNYRGTGSNYWWSFRWPSFSFTSGKKHWYSFEIKGTKSSNLILYLRAARSVNDWVTNAVQCTFDGTWHRMSVSQTLTEGTYNRSGTDVTVVPRLECYTNNMSTEDASYTADFYIRNVQVVESDEDIPFIMNEGQDTIVYDCSGYKHNGTITGDLTLSTDSAIGELSTAFSGSQVIKNTDAIWQNLSLDGLTISFWMYGTGKGVGGIQRENASKGALTYFSNNWQYMNGSTWKYTSGGSSSDAWHHYVAVMQNSVLTTYQDGTQITSTTDSDMQMTPDSTSYFAIGCDFPGGDEYFTGKVCDFRVYSTALSASDILELYQTRESIADNGTVFCDEVIEVDGQEVEFGKNGVVSANEFGSGIGRRNYALGTSTSYTSGYSSFTGVANTCPSLARVYVPSNAKAGDYLTVSLDYKYENIVATDGQTARCWIQGSGNTTAWTSGAFNSCPALTLSGSGTHHFQYNILLTSSHLENAYWTTNIRHDYVASGTVSWKNFKVELGKGSTPWCPAPEDTTSVTPAAVTTAAIYDNALMAREIIER